MSLKWIYRLSFLLLLFFSFFLFFKLKPIWLPIIELLGKAILPFTIAAFISYLLHPVVELLHKRGWNRSISILLIYILFFGSIGFAVYKGFPIMVREVESLIESTPQFAEKYNGLLKIIEEKTSDWPIEFQQRIEQGIFFFEHKVEVLLSKIMNFLINSFDYIIVIAIIPLIAFYFLKDWERIKKAAWYITPASIRKQSITFLEDVEESLGNYIRGQLLVCVIIGTLSALILWFLKVKYSLLLGVFIGITNIIPYFGPIIGAVPAVMVAAASGMKQVIWVAVIVFGLQFLEGNILSPLIVGKSLHMHPLLIMLSLFIGGEVGGIFGLVVSVPILAISKVAILHAKEHFIKERKKEERLKGR